MPKDILSDVTLTASHGKPVTLPQGTSIADVEFAREGQDLTLQLPDGTSIHIEGYFNHTPDILAEGGAKLSPQLVQAFLPPSHPNEYAQSGEASASDASPIGKITEVVGDAVIVRGGEKIPATVGAEIRQGDVIQTGEKGSLNILFADNTTFAISQNARLSVDQFTYDAESHEGSSFFSMLQGMFVYTSGLIGKEDPASVNINTPVGSIGIRGTVVTGNIMPAGQESTITVVDGAIVITNAGGTLSMGDAFDTAVLTGYDTAPKDSGQMTSAAFTSTYSALSPVASDVFTGVSNGTYSAPNSNNGTTPDAPAPDAPTDGGTNTPTDAQPAPVPAPTDAAPTDAAPTGSAPAPAGTVPAEATAPLPADSTQPGTAPLPADATSAPATTAPTGTPPLPGDSTQPAPAGSEPVTPTYTAPITAPLTAPVEGGALNPGSPTTTTTTTAGSTFGGTTGGTSFGGTAGSTFGGTGTTTTTTTGGTTTTSGGTSSGSGTTTGGTPPPPTLPNTAPPVTPEVRMLFSNTYLNNTPGNISDDGIPLLGFGLVGTTILLGHIDFRGFDPATVDLSITANGGTTLNLNGNFLESPGSTLFYNGTAPSTTTMLTAAANPIVYFDLTNNNLYLNAADPFTLINNIQGPFNYTLTVTDQLGHSASHTFGVIFNSPTPGGPMNIQVGDHGVSSNPNVPGSPFPDTMAGTLGNDLFYGRDGNDLMTTNTGGQDVMIGGNGNDQVRVQLGAQARVFGQAGDDIISFDSAGFITDPFSYADGGAGDDHIFLGTAGAGSVGQNFNFTLNPNNNKLFNIEMLKLSSPQTGDHTLRLDFQDIFDMTDSNHELTIMNDPLGLNTNDVFISLNGWSLAPATPTAYAAGSGSYTITASHNTQTVTLIIETGISPSNGIDVTIN